MFKLAFHTYEALANKDKLDDRKQKKEQGIDDDKQSELDLISNNSDESTMTMGGPASIREKKIERITESLDVKLNRYLTKWIFVILFYQIQWVFTILGYALPAVPLFQMLLGLWIMLPQQSGEQHLMMALESYIIKVEMKLMSARCIVCSHIVSFFQLLSMGALKFGVSFISEECIVNSQESTEKTFEILQNEVKCRVENGGRPLAP